MRKSFQRPGKKNIWTKKEVSDAKPSRAPAKKRKRKDGASVRGTGTGTDLPRLIS